MSVLYNLIMWWGQGGAGIGGCNRGVHELGSLGSKKLNKARMSTCNTSAFLSRHKSSLSLAGQRLFGRLQMRKRLQRPRDRTVHERVRRKW